MVFVCLRAKATRHGKSRMKSEKAEAASLKPARDRKKKTSQHVNRRNVWLIVATVLLVLGSVFAFMPPQEKINQGLDIQGGLSVVLTAKSTSGDAVSSEDMEKSRSIIESRVNALGASEASVSLQGNDQILVQIPGLSDTEAALDTIGRTGKLEFARLDSFTYETVKTKIDNGQYVTQETVTDAAGNKFPTGKQSYDLEVAEGTYTPLVTGSDITRVTVDKESEASANYAVDITLNSEGAKAFEEATRDLAADHGKIVIILDGKVQSAPAVQGVISGGRVRCRWASSTRRAKPLARRLAKMRLLLACLWPQSAWRSLCSTCSSSIMAWVLSPLPPWPCSHVYTWAFWRCFRILACSAYRWRASRASCSPLVWPPTRRFLRSSVSVRKYAWAAACAPRPLRACATAF